MTTCPIRTSVMLSLFTWSPSCICHQGFRQPKAKWRQVTKTRPPPPSLSKRHQRHHLHYWASHQEGSPSPHKVSLPLHTKSEGHTMNTMIACRSKTSLKLALSRAKPNQAISTLTSVLKLIWCTMKLYGGWRCSSSVVDFSISSATPALTKWGMGWDIYSPTHQN